MMLLAIIRALFERIGLVPPLPTDEEFRADPVLRRVVELMGDPARGVAMPPPRLTADEIRAAAEEMR